MHVGIDYVPHSSRRSRAPEKQKGNGAFLSLVLAKQASPLRVGGGYTYRPGESFR